MDAVLEQAPTSKAAKAQLLLSHFQHALKVVSPAVPSSHAVPILQSVRIEQLPSGLAISASDLSVAIRALVPQNTDLNAVVGIPTTTLLPWVKLLAGESVSLSATESRVTLTAGRAKAAMPRIKGSSLPSSAFELDTPKIQFKQETFLRVLKFASLAIGPEERYTMNGVLLIADGEHLRAVSTDGHRMIVYTVPCEETTEGWGTQHAVFMPEAMLKALAPVLIDDNEMVTLQENQTLLLASIAADVPVFVNCLKIQGAFPNWKAIVPAKRGMSIRVASDRFLEAVQRCVLMGSKETKAIALTFSDGEIKIESSDPQAGESTEVVDCEGGPATPTRIGMNGSYLVSVLRQLSGSVTVELQHEADRVVTLRATPAEGETFDYYVMPLRLPN